MTYMPNGQQVSTGNSSTTPLGSSETFTGTGELNAYPDVFVMCFTDQSGTLFFDFSSDGTNWDSTFPTAGFAVTASIPEVHKAVKGYRYFRVRLVNGSIAQSILRLHVTYGDYGSLNAPLNQGIGDDSDAATVKAVLSGEDSSGTYRNVQVNSAGSLSVTDFNQEVGRGEKPGFNAVQKFGRNPEIDTTTDPEDVWSGGGDYTGQPTGSPETVDVSSSSANDASAGTGMRTIRLYGLLTSSSTSETTEDITLNGTTAVTSTNTWYRVYRAKGLTYGSGGTNAGTINVEHTTTSANVFVSIPPGDGQTQIAAWTCPAGATAQLIGFHVNLSRASGAAGSADVSLRVREFGSGGYNAARDYTVTTSVPVDRRYPFGINIPAQADVKVRVDSVSDNDSIVTADMDFLVKTS